MGVGVLAVVERTLGSGSHLGFLLLLLSVILGRAASLDLKPLVKQEDRARLYYSESSVLAEAVVLDGKLDAVVSQTRSYSSV